MAKRTNEVSSVELAKIASRVLKRGFAFPRESMKLAGSVLTQRPAKKAAKKKTVAKKRRT